MAAHRPSPITFFDSTIHMGPAVVLRGDERAERYYEVLVAELEGRIADGVGAVDDETLRFYWEGMPVWGKLRDHAEQFARPPGVRGGLHLLQQLDLRRPRVRGPLRGHGPRLHRDLHRPLGGFQAASTWNRWCATTPSTGSSSTTPRPAPTTRTTDTALPLRLREKIGTPFVVIDGDLNDLRLYSEEQARTQFEALVEQLQEQPA